METTKIRVLDYYNRPGYYPYMPGELFKILESAFLEDKEFTDVPKEMFDKMIENVNNI